MRGRRITRWATYRAVLWGLLLAVLGAGPIAPAEPQGTPIHVCLQGCPFISIQEAIDAAPEGAIIEVGPGTYRENLLIQKSLWIIGSGSESTVIEGARWEFPFVRILGSQEDFLKELRGEGAAPTSRITVWLQRLGLRQAEPPEGLLPSTPSCFEALTLSPEGLGDEMCSAGIYVRGPINLQLSEIEIAGLPPDSRARLGVGIIADGSGWIMAHKLHIHDTSLGIIINGRIFLMPRELRLRPVKLIMSLSDSSIGPPMEGGVGILFNWGQLDLYRSQIHANALGIWITNAGATLIGNQINNNGTGILFKIRDPEPSGSLRLEYNVIKSNKIGLWIYPSELVQNVVVCEGNAFEENEENLSVTSYFPPRPDPEALAELARRCGVELRGQ